MTYLQSIRKWWRERQCGKGGHYWRPATSDFTPARGCQDCGRIERITAAEFYAEFGVLYEMVWGTSIAKIRWEGF